MKKTIFTCLFMASAMSLSAQNNMVFWHHASPWSWRTEVVTSASISGIDSVTFATDNELKEIIAVATTEKFYTDLSTNGGFASESLFGRDLMWEQGAACDIVWGRTRAFPTLATFNYRGNESPLTNSFNVIKNGIIGANTVIGSLEGIENRTEIGNRTLGEAYFFRAFYHFLLAYRYGTDKQGVPFTSSTTWSGWNITQQATVMEDYEMILADLDKAIMLLPVLSDLPKDERYRAQKQAALGLKAKVFAYWATWDSGKWTDVINTVNDLETTYGAGLNDNFEDNFTSDEKKWFGPEYLFGCPARKTLEYNVAGIELPGVVLENGAWGYMNGWGQIKPSYDIFEEMLKDGEDNVRLKRSILAYNDEFPFFGDTRRFYSTRDLESGFMINKYMEPFGHANPVDNDYVSTDGDWPVAKLNFPIIRFADILLLRAEAYLNQGHADLAAADINAVRTRSKLQSLKGNATFADLYHERRCELAFEYADHLFDLKRWHRSDDASLKALAEAELNAHPRVRHYEDRSNPLSDFTIGDYEDYRYKNTYQDYMMVFPYPSDEIDKSNGNIKQNEGY